MLKIKFIREIFSAEIKLEKQIQNLKNKYMKQRLEFIDASKALAILLVIVGHCYWKSSLSIATPAIYSFHMPLFFIISGMFIKALSIKESLLKYSKNYLKSYFVGGYYV